MQGMPPNHQNPGGQPRFRMNGSQPPRPLQVQQSRLTQAPGRPAVQNQRVPAVNTLKAGGPRLAPIQPAPTAARKKKKRNPADVRDFLLGLTVGLLIFGIAAIFVCGAVIDMFAFI